MSHRGDMIKLIKLVKKAGCTVDRTGSGHWKITTPSGVTVITAFSPSKSSSYRNAVHDLKKAGVKL